MQEYRVVVRVSAHPAPPRFVVTRRASSVHYAVREVLFGLRSYLPRGWEKLELEVTRQLGGK
jgi:hypothetical protein